MELQARGNREIAQKEMVSRFVHDVADMEVRAFTLRETAKKCRQELKSQERDVQDHLRICKSQYEEVQEAYRAAETRYKEVRDYETFVRKYHDKEYELEIIPSVHGIFAFLLGSSAIGVIMAGIMGEIDDTPQWMFFLPLIFVLDIVIYNLIRKQVKTERHGKMIRLFQSYSVLAEEKMNAIQEIYDKAERDNKTFEEYTKVKVMAQIADMESAANEIEEKLRQCYALNVIKPAYQNFVSVAILDEIFVNDKADTMREAMILCDSQLRHGELMGKMDQVMNVLDELASTLSHIGYMLNGIHTNVSLISQDVFKMTEKQDRIAYATESLQKSAENTDFYITQKRMGML